MDYKFAAVLLFVSIPSILCVRVPPNPCPNVFKYYKDPQGAIYGEVIVPYDYSTDMYLQVNSSIVGTYRNARLRLKLITQTNELNEYCKDVIYNIYFPFTDPIPRITLISYNNVEYCQGPEEPLYSLGITAIWAQTSFRFNRMKSAFYKPFHTVKTVSEISDVDIPIKKLYEQPHLPNPPVNPTPSTMASSSTSPPIQQPTSDVITTSNSMTEFPRTLSKTLETELEPIDQGLIDALFTHPQEFTSQPTPPTFTSPSVTNNEEFRCGVTSNESQNNLLGGSDFDVGQYPWLVALFVNRMSKYDYKCSASLISEYHVITAARCVQYYNIQIIKTKEIFLVMGAQDLGNWKKGDGVTRGAESVVVHPAFKKNSKSAHGDLAIITIDRPVQFSNVLSPVCLWRGNTDLYPLTNKIGVIAGFGQDEETRTHGVTHILRAKRAAMPIVSQTECLTSPLGFMDITSDRTFCTKTSKALTERCVRDSGAGFFILINESYFLRGIASAVSSSNGICDKSIKYSIFCDVAKFLDWIKSNIK